MPVHHDVTLHLSTLLWGQSTEYSEWQRPLSGVDSIMMVKLAQAGEGGGCTPTPFHYIYPHLQSCGVRSSWKGRFTPPISTLPLYVVQSNAEREGEGAIGENM